MSIHIGGCGKPHWLNCASKENKSQFCCGEEDDLKISNEKQFLRKIRCFECPSLVECELIVGI